MLSYSVSFTDQITNHHKNQKTGRFPFDISKGCLQFSKIEQLMFLLILQVTF